MAMGSHIRTLCPIEKILACLTSMLYQIASGLEMLRLDFDRKHAFDCVDLHVDFENIRLFSRYCCSPRAELTSAYLHSQVSIPH